MSNSAGARVPATLIAVFLVAFDPAAALGQGTLSTQGLGFPPGQLSTPAVSMGGAIGEADPLSPLNPAAISLLTATIVHFQAEPEFRETRLGGRMLRTSLARFPLFFGGIRLGSKWAVSVSAATLLDRTWQTSTRDSQFVGSDTIAATLRNRSDGSLADLRLAVSYAMTPWFRIGIGGHALSGRDVIRTVRAFDDTLRFVTDTQETTLSFGGNALSLGVQTMWPRIGAIGASYRRGGALRTYNLDQTLASGGAPDHFGASFVYLGIRGTTLAARAAKDTWSRLRPLNPSMNVHEGWDVGVGADATGPRFGESPVGLRAGVRWRTLPFSPDASPVKERTFSGGFALPMARGRAELSVGVLRASRTVSGASEDAWTISTGFAIRP